MRTRVRVLVIFAAAVAFLATANAAEVKKITKEELKPMLGKPDVVVLDVRRASEWDSSNIKIQGAVREDPEQVPKWMDKYSKDKTLVFYCA